MTKHKLNRIIVPFWVLITVICLAAIPKSDTKRLVWADEFNTGKKPNKEKWNIITGDGCPELCGFGNNELQYYSSENVKVEDGNLIIKAKKDSMGNRAYTSAKLVTKDKGDWQYGRIEVSAKLPEGRGTWPAIWMLPTLNRNLKWPADGEIDIMEHVGYNQGVVHGTIHTQKYNGMLGTQKTDSIHIPDAHRKFHTYAIEWDENCITWFVDDQQYNKIERGNDGREGWPFDGDFHLILNLAVGGNWGGKYGVDDSIWPQTLEIDYVRVYKL